MLEATRWQPWIGALSGGMRGAILWASEHTGLPTVVIAAVALVGSWHVFKRTLRFVIEVALTATLLLVLAKLGFLRW
jgi:hypothetical protein